MLCAIHVASSPGPSQLFSLAGKKWERAWDLKSRDKRRGKWCCARLAAKCWFQICHLWLIKHSSASPLRIVLPSLIISVAFLLIHIEPEHLKIVLAHAQFSRSATLPTLVYGPMSRKWLWIPGSPSLSRLHSKDLGAWGQGYYTCAVHVVMVAFVECKCSTM